MHVLDSRLVGFESQRLAVLFACPLVVFCCSNHLPSQLQPCDLSIGSAIAKRGVISNSFCVLEPTYRGQVVDLSRHDCSRYYNNFTQLSQGVGSRNCSMQKNNENISRTKTPYLIAQEAQFALFTDVISYHTTILARPYLRLIIGVDIPSDDAISHFNPSS